MSKIFLGQNLSQSSGTSKVCIPNIWRETNKQLQRQGKLRDRRGKIDRGKKEKREGKGVKGDNW